MTARLKKLIHVFALIVFSLCSYDAAAKQLKSLKSLDEDEIVLVGRVELLPPLEDFEQNLKTIGSKRYKNVANFMIGERAVDPENPRLRDNKYVDGVKLGQDFFIRRKRTDTFFYSGSMILTSSVMGGVMDRIVLPGGLKYAIRASDKAVYIGTFRYHRADYNAITKLDLLNDFERANKAFIKQFGNGVKLRPRSAVVIK
ncbi:MAG: hypothetical protein ACE5HM_04115 [Acidiferrobacterales bacterium]